MTRNNYHRYKKRLTANRRGPGGDASSSGTGTGGTQVVVGRNCHRKIEVFEANLERCIEQMRKAIAEFNYIAIDTEFPGVEYRSGGTCTLAGKYDQIRRNVDNLKLIQLGMTLSNKHGELATPVCTWEFNFRYDIKKDRCAADSRKFLEDGSIPWSRLKSEGIIPAHFAELLITSGVVCSPKNHFICFQGEYDFFYLMKVLTNQSLPATRTEASAFLDDYFCGKIIDVKFLLFHLTEATAPANFITANLRSYGLESLAGILDVKRHGKAHCAGSDSRLTAQVYFKLIKNNPGCKAQAQNFLGNVAGFDSIVPVISDVEPTARFF